MNPSRRLRILMVLESEFPASRGGGTESQMRTLGEALRRRGHRVTVLTPRLRDGAQARAGRHFGLAVGRLAYPQVRFLGGLVMLARLAVFLHQHRRRYDVAHVHIAHHLALVCCLLGPALGLRTVVKVAGSWELAGGLLGRDGGALAHVLRPLWRRADAWQAVSTRIAATLVGLGMARERVHAIPNAVDLARYAVRPRPRAAGAPRVLAFVGRLAPEKDLSSLVHAWAQVFGERSDRHLWLVGSGSEGAGLQRRVVELGCTASVRFLGHHDDVADLLAEVDAGVLPSLMEGLSNTLLEFMACGLPVLASRVSGSEDLVQPGQTGWLHEPGDVEGLVAALRAFDAIDAAELARMGRNARAAVERHAATDHVIDRLLAVYAAPTVIGSDAMEAG
ncbi:MAG: glycosyltransferase family 4 protein [Rhodanobacteraceae bacterium]|jgi:glycosyltransferase involved in cell wall biosynthesis|nr:glycosyltransferase family 4 protein [Rhodanobacteraceae bacterium]